MGKFWDLSGMHEQEKRLTNSVVCFGSCQLDVKNVQLWRGTREVKLTGKAFAVLSYFVEHPGQLVTKDDLFAAAWPETVVSDATLASCIQEIRQVLGDDARKPRYIETVHRRGFRFIAEVVSNQHSVVSKEEENQKPVLSPSTSLRINSGEGAKGEAIKIEGETEIKEADATFLNDDGLRNGDPSAGEILPVPPLPKKETQLPPLGKGAARSAGGFATAGTVGNLEETLSLSVEPPRRFRPWRILLFLVVLLLGGVLIANWRLVRLVIASYTTSPVIDPVPLPLPDKPSLVVLPLVNLSGDASQEYFSDGLTDDLINTLAQFPDLFVIARHSAFTYKGKTIKEQDVGRELGVRYVLEGSVRRAGEQVRMNVQLVDATTGEQVWAERYDRPFTEVFVLQDALVQKLATTLRLQLSAWTHGFSARKTPENVEAYDATLRGLLQWARMTKKDNLRAREFFETALTLDPQYAGAYALVGVTYLTEWTMDWNRDPQTIEYVLEYGQKAVALNDFGALGHMVLAHGYVQKAQIDRALSEIERFITLQPNLAESYYVQGEVLMFAGRPREALPSLQHALRLSPRGPIHYFAVLGWAYQFTDQYAESIAAYKRTLALNPLFPPAYARQAFNYTAQWMTQQSHDPKLLDQAYDAAQNGITLKSDYPLAHTALGTVYLWRKHYDNALAEFERAVKLDGNYVCGHMLLADGLGAVGRVEEAVQAGERALSLKALPLDDRCLYGVASAYALAGRLEEAAALSQRLLQQFPNFLESHLALAAIYSELGREAEARAEAAEVLRLNPNFSLEIHKQRVPLKDPAMLERHIAALRKAGLK
jgi:TolB-like protein/DNA-binding winged helix-turn-helix (wHTH) protein/Flp pilus assembly protein TadD